MQIALPPSPKILVVVLQRLGDVLLATPLIRSLKRAWPDARIDVLVFSDTAGILQGNPDIDNILVMSPRRGAAESLALSARLWRRYALAISTQPGDRPTFFACIAGRYRVAPVEPRLGGVLKGLFLQQAVPAQGHIHRVRQVLRLAESLGIAPVGEIVPPRKPLPGDFIPSKPYAVIHAAPMFRYKQWSAAGWRGLAAALAQRGLDIVVTGGPGASERAYLDEIWQSSAAPVIRHDAALDWPELAAMIGGARVYVGPDTSVTHLAAATGCPTIALYGPTDPVLWGPWPAGGLSAPWESAGATQQRGNVWLIQNPLPCTPCQLEGCERKLESYSRCLDELPLGRVTDALDRALAAAKAA